MLINSDSSNGFWVNVSIVLSSTPLPASFYAGAWLVEAGTTTFPKVFREAAGNHDFPFKVKLVVPPSYVLITQTLDKFLKHIIERVLARNGSVRIGFGSTRISTWAGFRIATVFKPTRVSARDEFRVETGFGLVSFFSRFGRFFWLRFESASIFSVFFFFFCFVSVFCFRLVSLFG
ncbi:putative translation initiation factor 2, alpha subunit [Helianthus annuus]|nr:putative translation initiation factor 2, alpha subunit [Helianthus annuus]KAJ0608999.1 putative translation initiation factor 2, alpha subunit [Helianthus annuus]